MAEPALKLPNDPNSEVLDTLRRLEPTLARIETEQKEQRRDIVKLKEDVAEIKGRMIGIEGQLRQIPTLWQIAALIFAIFGASFVLIRFASGH